jgi:hypothetical protein
MRLYEPEGFTQRPEVLDILENRIPAQQYGYPNTGDLRHFGGLTVAQAKELLTLLPPAQADDQQNYSPSFKEFVELGEQYPEMTFHGYVVGPERSDERITIEGFYLPLWTSDRVPIDLVRLGADEFDIIAPDSGYWERVGLETYPAYGNVLRAWWD